MTIKKRWGAIAIAAAALLARPRPAPAGEVDWAAIQPAFSGATFVKDDTKCVDCHAETIARYSHTAHSRAAKSAVDCESCHGPRSKHVESPDASLALANLSAARQSAVCLSCHEGNARASWKNGTHAGADVSCLSCHQVMVQKTDRSLLKQAKRSETCLACHAEVRAKMMKGSHHPLREERMDCASCHEVHGDKRALLKTDELNETCYSCHADKRGPFLWEHAPARENCASCHDAHGSINRNLLVRKDSFLCLQCHSYGGHINLPRYNRTSNPYGSGCVNCHTSVHGSNHPSGAKLTR